MPEAGRRPVSTYRLQLRPGFGFAEAAGVAGYLADLGTSHVYLSPVLAAAPGSEHGYDVVDHARLSGELGGERAFREMVARFREHSLGVVVDVVPNHMAVPAPESLNRQLWSVLREGPGSRYAHWFDIDWAAHGDRMLLPILAGPVEKALADLAVDAAEAEPVLRYFDHVLPLRPGTQTLPLPDLLAAQHYLLADWRTAATSLNWRRFFDISSLIAIRAEDEDVFAATHGLLLSLMAEGLIDALRVDHPDGLADPRGYFRRLAAATGGAWVAAEKILTGGEELPLDWPCAGTTGYDSLAAVGGVFADPAAAAPLTEAYRQATGGAARFAEVAEAAKRHIAADTLAAEVSRLARLAACAGTPALAQAGHSDIREALVELLASFRVYRAYVSPGEPPPPQAVGAVSAAADGARARLPGRLHGVLAGVAALALGGAGGGRTPQDARCAAEFAVRFQQTCGPVIAKGVEDTAFYRWSRLISANEVGGDPDRLAVSPDEFHRFAGRLARDWPATMTTLSTHDTKRQEDVRARLAALTERPDRWAREAARWRQRAAALAGGPVLQPDTEQLLWQTLVGAWPIGPDRLAGYLLKAMREAKTRTSWTDPDPAYEEAALKLARAVLADPGLSRQIARFVAEIAPDARVNSLGAKLLQLAMPGVADVYQGCELAGYSLVDPDNRRAVDFGRRQALLAALDRGEPAGPAPDPGRAGESASSPAPAPARADGLDAEKLLVTSRTLRLRRDHPDWFGGSYEPLRAQGPAARHAVAFARGGSAVAFATRLPAALRRVGGWRDTVLPLPGRGPWRDTLTGLQHAGPRVPAARLTQRLPVALLVRVAGGGPGGLPPSSHSPRARARPSARGGW